MKSKIFFDGNCVVCDLEISHYKRIAPAEFELVDINSSDFDAKKFGLTVESVNREMHVITPSGEIKIGVDAFAHIWERIPRYSFANKLIRMPLIYNLAKVGYKAFVIIRPYLPKKNRSIRAV